MIRQLFHDGAPVTFFLFVSIGVVSIAALVKPRLFALLLLHPYSIVKNKQYYRLFTMDLVHADWVHFLLNEFMLYLSCANLEESLRKGSQFGSWEFLFIYLMSYSTGVAVTMIRHRNDFDFSSAGASGSIVGCMISFMMIKPNFIAFYLPVIGGVKNKFDGLFYILMLIWLQRKRNDGVINNELHFFGALGGVIATLILFPKMI